MFPIAKLITIKKKETNLLAAIETPIPDPQHKIPKLSSFLSTSYANFYAKSG